MDKLLETINKLNLAVRAGILAGAVIAITAASFFLLVSDVEASIVALQNEQDVLDKTKAEKKEIADNLNERRREMDSLEQKLQDALTELPEKKDIDELLSQFNDIGKKSGLEINKVVPGSESAGQFYTRIPVQMSVTGNYHEIAMFLQEISNMRRIVNVQGIKLGSPALKNDKMILRSEFLATTFRFSDPKTKQAGKKGAAP